MTITEVVYKSAREQIQYLKKNGLKFEGIAEVEAEEYLTEYSYYHKIVSYKILLSNYSTDENGEDVFNGIDFSDLYELQVVDNRLREALSLITLRVEFYFKVYLIKQMEYEPACINDPYYYYKILDVDKRFNVTNKMVKRAKEYGDLYSQKMLEMYPDKKPIWVLNEYLSFGEVIELYAGLVRKKRIMSKEFELDLLMDIKSLRNKTVHNNSLLNSRGLGKKDVKPLIKKYNDNLGVNISEGMLHNHFVYEVASLLYLYKVLAPRDVYAEDVNRLYNTLHEVIKQNYIFTKYAGEDVVASVRTIAKITNKMY